MQRKNESRVSFYYTKQGYALLAGKSRASHCFGGEPYHKGANVRCAKPRCCFWPIWTVPPFGKRKRQSFFINSIDCRFITAGRVVLKRSPTESSTDQHSKF